VRILEVTDFYYPWIGGPSRFVESVARGLAGLGCEVTIVCPSPAGPSWSEFGSPRLERVRTWPIPVGYHLRVGLPLFSVERLIRRWRPDVVHIHHPFPISAAAMLAAQRHRIPVVATNHTIPACSLYGLRGSPFYRIAMVAFGAYLAGFLRRANVVTTPTHTAARMLAELGYRGTVTVVSNGVDTARFLPATNIGNDTVPVVLYTGRLDAEKDMETWVRAIPFVLQHCRARFLIGGEGTDKPRLERLVTALGLSDHVNFIGYVAEDALPTIYQVASVYAISSPVELQSISTLEAMAAGLPIVAVNAGALPELVHSGLNGLLTPPRDAASFAAAIVAILSDPTRRRSMGQMSRAIAETHRIECTVEQYIQIFTHVCSRGSTGGGL
jgi:1,2-diacylglycerol 3-alpha-glucosyltransferase